MSKSNNLESGILKLIYQNVDLANIGDTIGLRGSSAPNNFYIALYTDDPTDADVGTETTYTSYARVTIVRSVLGWTVSGNSCSNAGIITFTTSTGGTETITHFGVRTALTGGDLVHYGALTTPLIVTNGITPKFEINDLTITED